MNIHEISFLKVFLDVLLYCSVITLISLSINALLGIITTNYKSVLYILFFVLRFNYNRGCFVRHTTNTFKKCEFISYPTSQLVKVLVNNETRKPTTQSRLNVMIRILPCKTALATQTTAATPRVVWLCRSTLHSFLVAVLYIRFQISNETFLCIIYQRNPLS